MQPPRRQSKNCKPQSARFYTYSDGLQTKNVGQWIETGYVSFGDIAAKGQYSS
jgi:hypothetical protein